MEYQIKSPRLLGDIVHLGSVAAAMAKVRATAGDGFHKPTYDGALGEFTAMLAQAVNDGHLIGCDQVGAEIEPTEILKRAKSTGRIVESLEDENATFAMNICVALARLNQWGAERGNTFTIEDTPWIDERGWQGLNGKQPPELNIHADPATAPEQNIGVQKPDDSLLATPAELLDAFGKWGMKAAWFDELDSHQWLLDARRKKGHGQRGHVIKPLFCPFAVMNGMIDKVRKAKRLQPGTAWRTLEHKFPIAYAAFKVYDPREQTGD